MNQPKITVVVPVYGVEKYLDRCINSIVNQTYRNLEILLIDDGSVDNCPAMCDEWAEKDSRIRVIHKKNEGLGMARNTGIENATGKYICFFDSDDYVALDTLEKACASIEAEKAEVLVFGFSSVDANGKIYYSFAPKAAIFRGDEVLSHFLPDLVAPPPKGDGKRKFYMSTCMMLYATDVFNRSGWRFVSERDIISEDVYFLLGLFKYVNSVTSLSASLYYYCENGASLSRSYRPNRYAGIVHFYKESMALCEAMGYNDEVKHRLAKPYLAYTLSALKQEAAADIPLRRRLANINSIICDEILQVVLRQCQGDTASFTRIVMFFCMKRKWTTVCYCLLRARS